MCSDRNSKKINKSKALDSVFSCKSWSPFRTIEVFFTLCLLILSKQTKEESVLCSQLESLISILVTVTLEYSSAMLKVKLVKNR